VTIRRTVRLRSLWPASLFGRIALILFCGLSAAHVLSLGLLLYDRAQIVSAMMIAYLAKDVASSIAILERIPPEERKEWLPKIDRNNYRYALGREAGDRAAPTATAQSVAAMVSRELGAAYAVTVNAPTQASDPPRFDLALTLRDGTPVTVELSPPDTGLSS
jgi:hypothetical protein